MTPDFRNLVWRERFAVGEMVEKRTHFGRAGEYFAMSELLLRGWNVAVPVVDVGDDVFVIDDNDKTTFRLQVKTAHGANTNGSLEASFTNLTRAQLRTPQPVELFYMLVVRVADGWRFLVIPREALALIRDNFVETGTSGKRGRPPVSDEAAKTDTLTLRVTIVGEYATAWNADLSEYLGTWPDSLAPVSAGPGAVGQSATALAAGLVPSPDREM